MFFTLFEFQMVCLRDTQFIEVKPNEDVHTGLKTMPDP
jgi:hypothetical protein